MSVCYMPVLKMPKKEIPVMFRGDRDVPKSMYKKSAMHYLNTGVKIRTQRAFSAVDRLAGRGVI